MQVVVVGAGIVGAAVAYEAARAGAEVTVLDRSLPASGATGASFAWVGRPRSHDEPTASTSLRHQAMDEYRRLEREVPGVHVKWHGSVHWGYDDLVGLRPGQDENHLDLRQVHALEPHVTQPPEQALHLTGDGAVDPSAVTHALVEAARGHGALLLSSTTATRLRVAAGRVAGVDTTGGFVPSDVAVVTAGTEVPVLCAPLGVDLPVRPSPALLMRFTGPAGLVRTLLATPAIEVRQADGMLLVAADHDGEASQDDLDRAGHAMLERLRLFLDDTDELRLHSVRVGARPMPADGQPVIGPLDTLAGVSGAYAAVMHSGITLAPAVGRLVAREIVHGERADELEHLRPDRFAVPHRSHTPGLDGRR